MSDKTFQFFHSLMWLLVQMFFVTGAERKSAVIQEENRRLVAYHEAGHAVVAMCTPGMSYVVFTVPLICSVSCHHTFTV